MEKQLEAALKEIKNLNDKYDTLYREFAMMKVYASELETELKAYKKETRANNFQSILDEADAAMKRFTNKLKKECEEYAKQKQSEREQTGEACS